MPSWLLLVSICISGKYEKNTLLDTKLSFLAGEENFIHEISGNDFQPIYALQQLVLSAEPSTF